MSETEKACVENPAGTNKRTWETLSYDEQLQTHTDKAKAAVKLSFMVGQLLYEKGIELVLNRQKLVDATNSQILRLHDYATKVVLRDIDVTTTSVLAEALMEIDIAPAKLDIARLAYEFLEKNPDSLSPTEFLKQTLQGLKKENQRTITPRDVVLYGFGRIGRLAARMLILGAGKGIQLRLRAIVVRDKSKEDILKRAALFQNDSVHGQFRGQVEVDVEHQTLCLNGQVVQVICANQPEDIDYTKYGIRDALVIDNTGVFNDKEKLSRHLVSKGVAKVLLTAPGGGIPNIVYGINHNTIDLENDKIVCAASCTTNAISPILQVVESTYGVQKGHIETIHSYTNDQNLLDNFHKKARRGRSAAVNMVITETGAGKAVPKIIPSLQDKLTANAVRVPTPNASLAILALDLKKPVGSKEEINDVIRRASVKGDLVSQIHYSIDPEMVSSDVIGCAAPAFYDSFATIVSKDKMNVVLYTFYDNEYGYTKQVIRLAKHVMGVRRAVYYF